MVAQRWLTLVVLGCARGSAGIVVRFVDLCGGQLAVGAQLWCRVLWWTLFAGSWWLVEPACGESQEEQWLGVSRDSLSVT